MGDSETECSYSPTECSSPILYTGAEGVLCKEQGADYNEVSSSAPIAQQELVDSFVESQPQPPETQFLSSQTIGTLDALAGLDSMLDHPVPLFERTPSATPIDNFSASKQLTRATSQRNVKFRSLDLILAKVSTSSLDKYTLASKLDVQDMKLLINTCGEVVSSKATKSTMIDQLMQLIECGTWDKVFRSVSAVSIQRTTQSESQMDTCADTQAPRIPAQRTLSLPLLPPHTMHTTYTTQAHHTQQPPQTSYPLQRASSTSSFAAGSAQSAMSHSAAKHNRYHESNIGINPYAPSSAGPSASTPAGVPSAAVVVIAGKHSDTADWAPVTDEALLSELNGSGPSTAGSAASAAPVLTAAVQFGGYGISKSKGGSGGAFFAEQPSSAWQSCDADTQILLEENDSFLQFRRRLQRLERSNAGTFSGIDLSRVVAAASPLPADDTNDTSNKSTGESNVGKTANSSLLDSLRDKLKHIVASDTGTGTSTVSSSRGSDHLVSPSVVPSCAAPLEAPSLWSTFDALKLVVFRQDKLGLSLVKQVGVSGVESVVIQSKNPAVLDPRADRLLNVGDELVCVQGASLPAISSRDEFVSGSNKGSYNSKESSSGINFNAVMECLKQTPRPLQLGFVPPTSK